MDKDNELKRKYEILPGVSVPDMKTLAEASENYDEVGVDEFEVKAVHRIMPDGKPDAATKAELEQLKALGMEVAEVEDRQSEESRKRMESILSTAVQAPSTLTDLKKDAAKKASDEKKKKEIEESLRQEEAAKAEEEAKQKAREERRKLQQQMLEDAKKKAEAEKAKAEAAKEESKSAETKVEEPKPAESKEEPKAEPDRSKLLVETPKIKFKPAEHLRPEKPEEKVVAEAVDADSSADLADAEFGEFIDRQLLDDDEDIVLAVDPEEEKDDGSEDNGGFLF